MSSHHRMHYHDYDGYTYGSYRELKSSCAFQLHLNLNQVRECSNYETLYRAEGKLESRNCLSKMSIKLDSTSTNYFTSAQSFAFIIGFLCIVQATAIGLQILHGWRVNNSSAIYPLTVAILLVLTIHSTIALSILADVLHIYSFVGAFITGAIMSVICSGAYT